MINLVNIKIYEIKYINQLYAGCERCIDSIMILDNDRSLKDVFEELFDSIKYDYCDYPKRFKMHVDIIDIIENKTSDNIIRGFYCEYLVNNYNDIEEISSLL